MERTTRTAFPGLVATLAILFSTFPRSSFATSVAYCSSENTGSDNTESTSIYQSNGECNTQCAASHPFGVILGANCWCSDYAPANTVDVSECNDACIGWPYEDCGNKDKNLYIYIRLDSDAEIKGTQGASQATSASVPSSSVSAVASSSAEATSSEVITPSATPRSSSVPSSSAIRTDPATVIHTVTVSASVAPSTPTPTPTPGSSQAAGSTTFKTTSVPSSSNTPVDTSPATSVRVVTLSGVVVTQTVVSTPTSASANVTTQPKQSSHVGAIVGGVIGGLALLGAIAGGVLFFLIKRRRQQQQQQQDGDQSGVQRNTSTMSKSGLLGRGEKRPQYPPNIATTFGSQNSRVLDNESISPISASDRRNSRLMFDQRLNPSAIMVLDNPSRDSFASMDDSRDYGRTLNVRNPDLDNR